MAMTHKKWFYLIVAVVVECAVICAFALSDGGGRLTPYEEWAKTASAKSLLQCVRDTVTALTANRKVESSDGADYPWIGLPAGVFVTAMQGAKVRACVGVFMPREKTMGEEIVRQCRRLAREDPRHKPLSPYELERLYFVISIAGDPVPIERPGDCDIWNEGLLMRWNGREAVLLPGEAKTLAWGVRELRRQLSVPKDETPTYARFSVVVLREEISKDNSKDKK